MASKFSSIHLDIAGYFVYTLLVMPSIYLFLRYSYGGLSRIIEIGADRFKIPDIMFNPTLIQVL